MTKPVQSDSRETTPSPPPVIPKKKKSPKKNELKWFKGNSNKTRAPKKLLKHAQKESTPQQLPIPARVVEFDIDGHTERLGVSEILSIIDKGNVNYDLPQTPDLADDSFNSNFPNSPFSTTPLTTTKAGKGKGTLKRPNKNRVTATPKISTNPNNNWNISENSESNSNSSPNKFPEGIFGILDDYTLRVASPMPNSYIRYMEKRPEELENEVEYDIDEEDFAWLELVNEKRQTIKRQSVPPEDMEFLLDRLEKESYFQMQSTGMEQAPLIDDDAVCCICMDGECQNSNAILFCDMCNLAVHQECYGVPYIPEGQWLCRRCLQSPSRAVDCALCPNKGGAFKQTDDGRWAHVICAIWIPEVCFANTVFLEPIDSVNNIPAARWKLCCYICKQKGVGACIQCQKSNCYTAFHVTCAQQANLCMSMDTVVEGNAVIVKKTAYCDHHAPPENERREDSQRHKLKHTRKLLAEKRSAIPIVSIPTIPNSRIEELTKEVNFLWKHQFMKRLMAYWKLKRQQRNGVPLIRRLQAASTASASSTITYRDANRPIGSIEFTTTLNYYQYWVRMRQDLEKARLLCELIRKRERLKRTFVHLKHSELNLTIKPFSSVLLNVVDELMARDVSEIFCEPVDTTEVVDYLNVIKKPMDLSTMKEKINSFEYSSLDDLQKDFELMIRNCLMYNGRDTIYYKAGLRLRELGSVVFRQAGKLINSVGYDNATGLHLKDRISPELPVLEDSEIIEKVDEFLESEERFKLPLEKHLEELRNHMDETLAVMQPVKRKNRFQRVRCELIRLGKIKNYKNDPVIGFREYLESKHNSIFLTDTDASDIPLLNCDPDIAPFRVGVSPTKKVEDTPSKEKETEGTPRTTRSPKMQRSKSRSLRPIKRKILAESPLKDSGSEGSPVKETPKKKSKTMHNKIVTSSKTFKKRRRDSVSPTRKSQRISLAHDIASQQQFDPPLVLTPSLKALIKVSPTAKLRKCGSFVIEVPSGDDDDEESLPDLQGPPLPSPTPARNLLLDFDSDDLGEPREPTFDDYDNDEGDINKDFTFRGRLSDSSSPSPSARSRVSRASSRSRESSRSRASSKSSVPSLIPFDPPLVSSDAISEIQRDAGIMPRTVSPTRPIEVFINETHDNSSVSGLANSAVSPTRSLPGRKGSNLKASEDGNLSDLPAENNDNSFASPAKSYSSLTTTDASFNSPSSVTSKRINTPNNISKGPSEFATPKLKKKGRPPKNKTTPVPNNIAKSNTPVSSNRRVISFTSPSPLKESPTKLKSPKGQKESKTPRKVKEFTESVKLKKDNKIKPTNSKKRSPKKSPSVSPRAAQTARMSSPRKGQGTSPKNSSPKKSTKSPTKASPRTPNNKMQNKRRLSSITSPTKQKKAKLLTPAKARLSRSRSQSEYRCQSRSPSITSIVRINRERAMASKPQPPNNNNNNSKINKITKTKKISEINSITTQTPAINNEAPKELNPNKFTAYRSLTPNDVESHSDEEAGVEAANEKDQCNKERQRLEDKISEKGEDKAETHNGLDDETKEACSKSLESIVKEVVEPINVLSTSTSINKVAPSQNPEINLPNNNTNSNNRVPAHSPSSESDLHEMSDDDDQSNPIFAKYINYDPQPLDLVWAVYEFKSWFPAMVVNPDGPFGTMDSGFKIHQPPAEMFVKRPTTGPAFLVEYFELKHHWKWVERNQLKPLGSDEDVDQYVLAAKSMLDLKEVKKAYERAILHQCRIQQHKECEQEKKRLALERAEKEKERLALEQVEKERLEREQAEIERHESERLEQERLEQERLEKDRLEREQIERKRAERIERERVERERLERERMELEDDESNNELLDVD